MTSLPAWRPIGLKIPLLIQKLGTLDIADEDSESFPKEMESFELCEAHISDKTEEPDERELAMGELMECVEETASPCLMNLDEPAVVLTTNQPLKLVSDL